VNGTTVCSPLTLIELKYTNRRTRCEAAARAEGFTAVELMATLPGEPLYAACGYVVVERTELHLPDGVRIGAARMRRELR